LLEEYPASQDLRSGLSALRSVSIEASSLALQDAPQAIAASSAAFFAERSLSPAFRALLPVFQGVSCDKMSSLTLFWRYLNAFPEFYFRYFFGRADLNLL
jgi:hypothetical protein